MENICLITDKRKLHELWFERLTRTTLFMSCSAYCVSMTKKTVVASLSTTQSHDLSFFWGQTSVSIVPHPSPFSHAHFFWCFFSLSTILRRRLLLHLNKSRALHWHRIISSLIPASEKREDRNLDKRLLRNPEKQVNTTIYQCHGWLKCLPSVCIQSGLPIFCDELRASG